ncbi:MAG: molybdenum cofactor guanylyltransferase [Chloroflexi bacterium]|nr:molybdenum cofactor guanylyltransferase [Chloroflexota bacterium]
MGAVLAGGQSRRLGRDKALLSLEGRTLLERAVVALEAVTARVIVVGPPERRPFTGAADIVPDAYPGTGPLGAIATALEAVATPRVLVVACDLPFLSAPFLDRLVSCSKGWDITVPLVAGRTHQLHAVYAQSALPAIRRQLTSGDLRVENVFPLLRVRYVDELDLGVSGADLRSVWNVNTPEEWAYVQRSFGTEPAEDGERLSASGG